MKFDDNGTLTIIASVDTPFSEDMRAELIGQWITVLAFGSATLARITEAHPSDVDDRRVWLSLVIDTPAEEPISEPLEVQGQRVIHLDECEHRSASSAQVSFRDARFMNATMCPQVQYMEGELFADEMVWMEVP
ncbi:MAG TPA: hypothetical protein VFG99_11830 [Chloroflexia bacterium]|nr:hypothetical protein [Chloroflexia bacterium]